MRQVTYILVAGAMAISVSTARAEVGYSMRGNPQPFRNWDSAFNNSAREHLDDGIVLKAGGFGLRPHLGFWAGEIDNVYLDSEAGVEDSYTTIAPGLMLTWGNEEDDYATLNYVYENTAYSEQEGLDDESHLLSLGVQLLPGRFRIHLSDQYSDTTDENPETAQLTSKIQNIEQLRVRREVSQKTAFELEQRYEINDYQVESFLDYDEYGFGGRGYHQTFAKVRTFADVLFGRIDMDDPDVMGDADTLEVGGGIQGRLTAKTSAHARAAWHRRDFDDTIEDIETWTASAGLSSRLSNRTDWGLDVSRRLTPSAQREGLTRETTAVMPSLRHVLWRDRLACSLRGAYEWADYYGPEGEWDRQDRYWYVTAVIDWHPAQPFTVGVGFTHAEQDSDEDSADYEQDHLFVRAMLNY